MQLRPRRCPSISNRIEAAKPDERLSWADGAGTTCDGKERSGRRVEDVVNLYSIIMLFGMGVSRLWDGRDGRGGGLGISSFFSITGLDK